MGVFAKFAAVLISIPSPVMGGMTTFLFCSVAVSGMAVVTRGVVFTRRNRFILTASLALGLGATLVPNYFDNVFTYSGENRALRGFLDAIVLIMKTGFPVTAFLAMILNLMLEEAAEDESPADGRRAIGSYTDKEEEDSMAKKSEGVETRSLDNVETSLVVIGAARRDVEAARAN